MWPHGGQADIWLVKAASDPDQCHADTVCLEQAVCLCWSGACACAGAWRSSWAGMCRSDCPTGVASYVVAYVGSLRQMLVSDVVQSDDWLQVRSAFAPVQIWEPVHLKRAQPAIL